MSTITQIQSSDKLVDSRGVINTNLANLNSDKAEKSANLSDLTVKNTALNNLLPSQTGKSGKVLGSDGTDTSWVDPSGANLATNLVQGITALTVVAADPLLPKAVGDNDPRMLTTDQKAAAAGTGTPSGTNKFVTADTDALKELLSNKDTTVTLGTSDTKYPTQNAVKSYVDNQMTGWKYDGKVSFSSDTTKTYTLASTYDRVMVIIELKLSSGGSVVMNTNGYTGSNYTFVYISGNAIATSATQNNWLLNSSTTEYEATYYISGKIITNNKVNIHGIGGGETMASGDLIKGFTNYNTALGDLSTITITTSQTATGTIKIFGMNF
jgi:hypothetical protein